jgi:hypothetical protein
LISDSAAAMFSPLEWLEATRSGVNATLSSARPRSTFSTSGMSCGVL